MVQVLTEGQHEFKFDDNLSVEKFDDAMKIEKWAAVDFVVTDPDAGVTLIEVKNPGHPEAGRQRDNNLKKMKSNTLVDNELTRKARDTWAFLNLMDRTSGPVRYVVYIGDEGLSITPGLFERMNERLQSRLKREKPHEPWKRPYVRDSVILLASKTNDAKTSPFGFRVRRRT